MANTPLDLTSIKNLIEPKVTQQQVRVAKAAAVRDRKFYEVPQLVPKYLEYTAGPIVHSEKELACSKSVTISDRTISCPCPTNVKLQGEPLCHEHLFHVVNRLLHESGVMQTFRIKESAALALGQRDINLNFVGDKPTVGDI